MRAAMHMLNWNIIRHNSYLRYIHQL